MSDDEREPVSTFATNEKGVRLVPEDNFHKIDAPKFSDDLLVGANAFSTWLFGTSNRRRVYHLIETSRLPTFRLGSQIAAQKSVLRATFWAQQKRAFSNGDVEALVRLRLLLLKTLELIRAGEGKPTADHRRETTQLSVAVLEVSNEIGRLLENQ